MITVVAVLRSQRPLSKGEYRWEHAVALMRSVESYWPAGQELHRLVLTDTRLGCELEGIRERPLTHPWHGWWSKMELFDPVNDDLGDMLYLDLDTLIVGTLFDLARPDRGLTLLRDFYRPDRLGSGLMFLPQAVRRQAWDHWIASPGANMRTWRGDQDFLGALWGATAARWQDSVPGQVVSYKVHLKPQGGAIPDYAKVVCFHGHPRPWATPLWKKMVGV